MSFRDWFTANLADYAADIARGGADAGFPHITYNQEAAELFQTHAAEIWQWAVEDAEECGCKNVGDFIGTFGRADMLGDWHTFQVLMVWYAVERMAREAADA